MEDLNLSLVEKLWSLEEGTRVAPITEQTHVRKVRFALRTWKTQYKELQSRQDGKNGDVKDMKSEMYQLIGFFSVFQGVLFQGVSQLSIACRFRYIPMALSVAASLGTIFGVSFKFSDLLDIKERSNGDKISIKVLLYYINEIQRQGKDFSFLPAIAPAVVNSTGSVPGVAKNSNPSVEEERWKSKKEFDEGVERKRARLEKELENYTNLKYLILVYLILIGSGFAYVLSVIMAGTMVLVKTRVVNDLVDVDLVLKEANAGVYSMLGFLERNGGKYDITVNPDTTYREYWIGGALPSESIIITSDDAVDNVELRVIKRIDGKYDLKRTPRGMKSIKPPSLGSIKPPSLGSIKPPSLGSLFRKLFRIERGGSAKGGTNTEEGGRSAEIREIEQN